MHTSRPAHKLRIEDRRDDRGDDRDHPTPHVRNLRTSLGHLGQPRTFENPASLRWPTGLVSQPNFKNQNFVRLFCPNFS